MSARKLKGEKKIQRFISPMLAQLYNGSPFDDKDWIFELKWDGYRAIAEVGKSDVKLYSRNGLSFAEHYNKVTDALKKIKRDMVLDGEIVALDKSGKPNFQQLQNYMTSSATPLLFMVFDCLSLDGEDLTKLPLIERKRILKDALPKQSSVITYCDHVDESGEAFFHQVQKENFEGMIAKRAMSLYYTGRRTSDWLKIKNVRSEEAVIVGFTAPKGSRAGFGSLLLGQYSGKKLIYIGNVGTGFTDAALRKLSSTLRALVVTKSPLGIDIKPPAHTTWVAPELVCNVKYTEKTSDGMVRHPVFQGLRVDKSPTSIVPEEDIDVIPKKKKRKSK